MDAGKIGLPTVEQLEEELKNEEQKRHLAREIRRALALVFLMAVIAAAIAWLFPAIQIGGDSMSPTLESGEIILSMPGKSMKRGDVICFRFQDRIMVKRVIAVSGDRVDLKENGDVYVNDVLQEEPYLAEKAFGACSVQLPYQVPAGSVFVMGDSRAVSVDSRSNAVGSISSDMIMGKLLLRIWPLNRIGAIH